MLALLLACATEGLDSAADAVPTLDPPEPGEGFQMVLEGTAPPKAESWLCAVYDLETTVLSPVNRVEYLQNGATHHMTLSTTALSGLRIDPGMYDCDALYSETTLMQDATMVFGAQGGAEGVIQLPEGVAALVPAGIQVVHELHFVNGYDEELPLYSYVNAYTIPESEVTDSVWGGQVRDENISIPAGSTSHTEWTRCTMNEDVEVHFLASHTHATATRFTIAPFDGTTVGEVFYENEYWADPLITQYNPPRVVPKGEGFEYTCTYENLTEAPVNYGYLSTDEMCNMTVVFTPGTTSARCEVVATSDGVLWEP